MNRNVTIPSGPFTNKTQTPKLSQIRRMVKEVNQMHVISSWTDIQFHCAFHCLWIIQFPNLFVSSSFPASSPQPPRLQLVAFFPDVVTSWTLRSPYAKPKSSFFFWLALGENWLGEKLGGLKRTMIGVEERWSIWLWLYWFCNDSGIHGHMHDSR